MGAWKRASLYLMRNKKKTMTLLAVLSAVSALVLLCVSVGNAADASLRELREQMGGYFKIETDYAQGKFGRIDDALAQKVADAGGIKAVNGMDVQYFMAEDMELEPGRFSAEGDAKAKLARFLGNTDSSLNEYFLLGYYSLTEGRHVAGDDSGKAVISDALAKRNRLSVGDTFRVRFDAENLPGEQAGLLTSHELEVAGIYHIDTPQGYRGAETAECDIEENFIFTDTAFIREVYGEAAGHGTDVYTGGVSFFAEDPKELDGIVGRLLESDDYDWDEYVLTKNNKTYEDSAAPLERLSGLVTVTVMAVALVSAAMLSLVLFLWMRERVHEIGIYLSIGIRKREIAGQRVLENLAVAAAAFLLAWGIAAAASGFAGRAVADSFSESGKTEETSGSKAERESGLEISVGTVELVEIAGLEILLVLLSTGISSAAVLRMQPKDILSKMS